MDFLILVKICSVKSEPSIFVFLKEDSRLAWRWWLSYCPYIGTVNERISVLFVMTWVTWCHGTFLISFKGISPTILLRWYACNGKRGPGLFYSLMPMSLSFHVVMCLKLSGWKIPVCFLVWRESIHHGPLSVLLQDSPEHRQLSHWWGTLKSLHNLAKGQEGVGRR